MSKIVIMNGTVSMNTSKYVCLKPKSYDALDLSLFIEKKFIFFSNHLEMKTHLFNIYVFF
jgi:hypothetical protein